MSRTRGHYQPGNRVSRRLDRWALLAEVAAGVIPALPLLLILASSSAAPEPAFTFGDLHLQSGNAEIAQRYPASRRVGDYVYVAPQDSHDHIYGIELPGPGPARRLRVSFERPDGVPSPDGRGRYPRCETVERILQQVYGPPAALDQFAEEASRRSDRLWQRSGEELRLICFGEPGRPMTLFAEAVTITPIAPDAAAMSKAMVGQRVRIQTAALGREWRVGMFNRTRTEPPCFLVLLFRPRASPAVPIEVESTIKIADVDRLAVFTGAPGPMQDWAGRTGQGGSETDWREVNLDALRAAREGARC